MLEMGKLVSKDGKLDENASFVPPWKEWQKIDPTCPPGPPPDHLAGLIAAMMEMEQQSMAEEKKLLKAFSNNSEPPQTRWIEIERCRILEVPREIFNDEYEKLDENGQKILGMERPELIRRVKDGKLFKVARYIPTIWQTAIIEFERSAIYLEEV